MVPIRAWLALLILAAAPVAQAQTPQVRAGAMTVTADDVEGSLKAFVRRQLERRKIAGAVIALVKDGVVLLEEGYGLADVALQRPMDRHTPMRIGSVTKLITALAVMQLADEGRVALDEDVNRISISLSLRRPAARR